MNRQLRLKKLNQLLGDNMLDAIIADIDGTIFNIVKRIELACEKLEIPKNTNINKLDKENRYKFLQHLLNPNKLHLDIPMKNVIDFLYDMHKKSNLPIIFLTSRPSTQQFIDNTYKQILQTKLPFYKLLMRPLGNEEPAHLLKVKILKKYNINPKFYIDDEKNNREAIQENFPSCIVFSPEDI